MRRSPSLLNFLSDLCGREDAEGTLDEAHQFLSDLCGREVNKIELWAVANFLSDLCGREVIGCKIGIE